MKRWFDRRRRKTEEVTVPVPRFLNAQPDGPLLPGGSVMTQPGPLASSPAGTVSDHMGDYLNDVLDTPIQDRPSAAEILTAADEIRARAESRPIHERFTRVSLPPPEPLMDEAHRHTIDYTLVETNIPGVSPEEQWKHCRLADVCSCEAFRLISPGGARTLWQTDPTGPPSNFYAVDARAKERAPDRVLPQGGNTMSLPTLLEDLPDEERCEHTAGTMLGPLRCRLARGHDEHEESRAHSFITGVSGGLLPEAHDGPDGEWGLRA